MKHLILIRHGQSELNVANTAQRFFCGQSETDLTEWGRAQAREVGRILAASTYLKPTHAVSSGHRRSQETLRLILEQLPCSVQVLPASSGFNERSLGDFQGQSESAVYKAFPQYCADPSLNQFANHFMQKAPRGENLTEVTERAWSAVQGTLQQASGDVLVVSHSTTIRCVVGKALSLTEEAILRLRVPNAVPIVLKMGFRPQLVEGIALE